MPLVCLKRQGMRKFVPRWLWGNVCLGLMLWSQVKVWASESADPPRSLTLEQAIEEAIQNNLGLLAERMNLTIAEASVIAARLRPNPVLSFSGDHLDLLGTGFNRENNGGPPEVAWRVDIPFERAHKRELRIETALYTKQIAEARLLDMIRKLKLDVSQACIDVLLAKGNLALQRDNLRTFEELVGLNDIRVKAGSISPLELTRSKVAMLQFRSNVKRAELELATAKSRLQNLLGRKVPSDEFDILGELKSPGPPPDLDFDKLCEMAFAGRPDALSLERSQARSVADLRLQLAQSKVDFLYGAEYRRQQGIAGKSNSLGFFFSIPLPLYNRNQGEIARVRAEQQQLARQAQALAAQICVEVKTAYQEFRSARDLVESIERDLLQPAESARDTSAYVYRTGASTLIEFLDAQRAFNETMQSYQEAQAQYRRAVIRLNTAVAKEVIGL